MKPTARDVCIPTFITVLFTIDKTNNLSAYQLMEEIKIWYIDTLNKHGKHGILLLAAPWLN